MTPGMTLLGTAEGVELTVRVQPRASRSEIAGVEPDALRVRIAAAPVEGAANRELKRLLASALGVAPSRIELLRGTRGRSKRILVRGLRPGDVVERLGL